MARARKDVIVCHGGSCLDDLAIHYGYEIVKTSDPTWRFAVVQGGEEYGRFSTHAAASEKCAELGLTHYDRSEASLRRSR